MDVSKRNVANQYFQKEEKFIKDAKKFKLVCPVMRNISYFNRFNKNGCSKRRKCVTRKIAGRLLSKKCTWASVVKCPTCSTQKCFGRKNKRGSKCCISKWKNGKRINFRCFNTLRRLKTRKTCNFIGSKKCHYIRKCIFRLKKNWK